MTTSTLIPCLRYRDAPKAIDWLCDTLGLERRLVVPGAEGVIEHAQLGLGGGTVMLGSVRPDTDYGREMRQPDEAGGNTQSVYLVVPDPDAVYARVRASGATLYMDIHDEDYGGRGFGFKDPEGHVWYVGSYDPSNET